MRPPRRTISINASACANASPKPALTRWRITNCSNCCCSARYRDATPNRCSRGSAISVLGAAPARIAEIPGAGAAVALDLKAIQAALERATGAPAAGGVKLVGALGLLQAGDGQ